MSLASRSLLAATALAALVLTSCGSGAEDPQPSGESDPTAEAPRRTTALAEAAESDFTCDCLSMPAGGNSEGMIAVARDVAGMQGGGDAPMVSVIDPSGAIAWEAPIQPATVSGMPEASFVVTETAIVAPVAEGMRGFGWDGTQLWTLPGEGPIEPDEVPGRDDLVLVKSVLFELNGMDSHPMVTLVDVATGATRWQGEDLDDYVIDDAAGALYAIRYAADGAVLLRVDLESGTESTATVASWRGEEGTSLAVDGDIVTAYLGPDDDRTEFAVSVGPVSGDTFEVTEAEVPTGDAGELTPPEGAERVDFDPELGLVLGAVLDDAGVPETAVLYDAEGTELWQKPAAEVLSWSGGDPASSDGARIVDGGEYGGPLVVVSRSSSPLEHDQGSVADADAAAYSVLDALTGDELWSWGDKERHGALEVSVEAGVALAVQSGSGDFMAPTDGPLEVEALDLRTGEADWAYAGEAVAGAAVYPAGTSMVVVPMAGPWLVTSVAERPEG